MYDKTTTTEIKIPVSDIWHALRRAGYQIPRNKEPGFRIENENEGSEWWSKDAVLVLRWAETERRQEVAEEACKP